jgi:hypothetical protein
MSTIFPKWINAIPALGAGAAISTLALAVGGIWYYATPEFWEVGYMPKQPGGGFNHQIHAGKLGMDCRYCHSHVENSAEANIPTVSTCYGCHSEGKLAKLAASDSSDAMGHKAKTQFIRDAYAANASIEWARVHKLPDYVRNFPHHAHISAGVSCISCHGNIARMPVVWQHESLSMGWCLECHRAPHEHLVPKAGDLKPDGSKYAESLATRLFDVEKMREDKQSMLDQGKRFYESRKIAAPENCGACHY